LRAAFLSLLAHKPLDQILIREITDRAGLSYPTFFRRFASKQELLEDIAADEVRSLLALSHVALTEGGGAGSGELPCRYVHEHRKLWKALLTGGAAAAMRDEFMRVASDFATTRPRVNPWLPMELAVPFVVSGIFEIFAWWMRQPEDYPVENVIKLFDALVVEPSGRPRDIALPAPRD
jgi:AcrR family transcriptional regulator